VLFCDATDAEGAALAELVPMCLPCADGEPCVVVRCNGAGRQVSATRIEQNVFGEVFDVGHVSAVIHRTPEELGIPREIPDVAPAPVIRDIRPDWADERTMRRAVRPKMSAPRPEPVIARVREEIDVEPPAPIAEPIVEHEEEIAAVEVVCEEREQMSNDKKHFGRGHRIPPEIRIKIAQEPDDLTLAQIARKYGVSEPTISKIRSGPRSPVNDPEPVAMSIEPVRMPVEIRKPLIDGLVRITLELTPHEIGQIVAGLSPAQSASFVSAGLRAALLS
jgi:hypothetical protein